MVLNKQAPSVVLMWCHKQALSVVLMWSVCDVDVVSQFFGYSKQMSIRNVTVLIALQAIE